MSNKAHLIGLKNRIADALADQGYQHPLFTTNGEKSGKKMSNRQIRNLARNLGVSLKDKEARRILRDKRKSKGEVESIGVEAPIVGAVEFEEGEVIDGQSE